MHEVLEKGNQKCGQEKMAERLMIHKANVRRRRVDRAEERRRRGNGTGASSSREEEEEEENEESLSGRTATVLLDEPREVKIPVEYLSAELVPRTVDERLLTAPPPFERPGEPEVEVEGPESPDHQIATRI